MQDLSRAEAVDLLCRRQLRAMSPDQRLDEIVTGWWDGPPPHDRDPHEAAADPTRLLHVLYEDGFPHLVQPEPPEHADDSRYDPIILGSLRTQYKGVTNAYIEQRLAAFGISEVMVSGTPERLFPCPCCGYLTIDSIGEYDVCPVCLWEDSGVRNPQQYSSVNGMTLGEARKRYQASKAQAGIVATEGSGAAEKYLYDQAFDVGESKWCIVPDNPP